MGTFRVIEQNIKDEIINQVRNNGMSVSEAAIQYDVTSRTIYGWLKKGVIDNDRNLILENNRLKKELEIAYRIIGRFTADAQASKR
jgi:transposase-like protein